MGGFSIWHWIIVLFFFCSIAAVINLIVWVAKRSVAQITNRDDRVGSTKDRSIQAVGTGHPEVAAVDHGCGISPAPHPHPERHLSSCSA